MRAEVNDEWHLTSSESFGVARRTKAKELWG